MKRLCKILSPAILMFCLICWMRGGKDILTGLYIVFPIMYIAIGAVCADFAKELLPCTLLTSAAFLIPVNLWFRMGSCMDLALLYIALSCTSHWLKTKIQHRRAK